MRDCLFTARRSASVIGEGQYKPLSMPPACTMLQAFKSPIDALALLHAASFHAKRRNVSHAGRVLAGPDCSSCSSSTMGHGTLATVSPRKSIDLGSSSPSRRLVVSSSGGDFLRPMAASSFIWGSTMVCPDPEIGAKGWSIQDIVAPSPVPFGATDFASTTKSMSEAYCTR